MNTRECIVYKHVANHDWKQVSTCLNGLHLWKCQNCGEWTRSFDKPNPGQALRDPENCQYYGSIVELDPQCRKSPHTVPQCVLNALTDYEKQLWKL